MPIAADDDDNDGDAKLRAKLLARLVQSADSKLRNKASNETNNNDDNEDEDEDENEIEIKPFAFNDKSKLSTSSAARSAVFCGHKSAEPKPSAKEARGVVARTDALLLTANDNITCVKHNDDKLQQNQVEKCNVICSSNNNNSNTNFAANDFKLEYSNNNNNNDDDDIGIGEQARATSALGELPRLPTNKCHALPKLQQANVALSQGHARRPSTTYQLPLLLNKMPLGDTLDDSDTTDSDTQTAVSNKPLAVHKLSRVGLRFNLRASASSPSSLSSPPPPPQLDDVEASSAPQRTSVAVNTEESFAEDYAQKSSPLQAACTPGNSHRRRRRRRSTISAALHALRLANSSNNSKHDDNNVDAEAEGCNSAFKLEANQRTIDDAMFEQSAHRRRTNSSPCGDLTANRARKLEARKKSFAVDLFALLALKKRNSLSSLLAGSASQSPPFCRSSQHNQQQQQQHSSGKQQQQSTTLTRRKQHQQQATNALTIPESGFKIVVMGAAQVGKTSIIARFLYDSFDAKHTPTVEDNYLVEFPYMKHTISINIADTSGTYQFPAMKKLAINSGDAFILVFSVDSRESFAEVESLRQAILDEREHAFFELCSCAVQVSAGSSQVAAANNDVGSQIILCQQQQQQLNHSPEATNSGKTCERLNAISAQYNCSAQTSAAVVANANNCNTSIRNNIGGDDDYDSDNNNNNISSNLSVAKHAATAKLCGSSLTLNQVLPTTTTSTAAAAASSSSAHQSSLSSSSGCSSCAATSATTVSTTRVCATTIEGSSNDVSRRSSMSTAVDTSLQRAWRRSPRPPMVIVANKCDLPAEKHLVNADEVEALVLIDWNNGYCKTSAAVNSNINNIFQQVLIQAKQPANLGQAIVSKRRKSLPPRLLSNSNINK